MGSIMGTVEVNRMVTTKAVTATVINRDSATKVSSTSTMTSNSNNNRVHLKAKGVEIICTILVVVLLLNLNLLTHPQAQARTIGVDSQVGMSRIIIKVELKDHSHKPSYHPRTSRAIMLLV